MRILLTGAAGFIGYHTALALLTEWDVFRGIDLGELKKVMKGSLLFDGRNVYEPAEGLGAGLEYIGIGVSKI